MAAILASTVATTTASFADGKKGKDGSTQVRFTAELAPALEVLGEGEAKYNKKNTKKGSEEKFKGEAKFPILNVASAEDAVFEMHLARGGTEYAVCLLRIKEIEYQYQSGNPVPTEIDAKYVVDVSQRTPFSGTPTLKEKVGGCTVAGVPGVPAVQELDTAEVFQQGFAGELLTGTFLPSTGHDDDD